MACDGAMFTFTGGFITDGLTLQKFNDTHRILTRLARRRTVLLNVVTVVNVVLGAV